MVGDHDLKPCLLLLLPFPLQLPNHRRQHKSTLVSLGNYLIDICP
jgi:hypothetical protein